MDDGLTQRASPGRTTFSTIIPAVEPTTSGYCQDPTPVPAFTYGATDPVTTVLVPDDSVSATDHYAFSIPKSIATTPGLQAASRRRPVDRVRRKAKQKAAKRARRRNR